MGFLRQHDTAISSSKLGYTLIKEQPLLLAWILSGSVAMNAYWT